MGNKRKLGAVASAIAALVMATATSNAFGAATTPTTSYSRYIDAGSSVATNSDGRTWEAQSGFTGGTIDSKVGLRWQSMLPDTVAETALSGPSAFNMAVPNGKYTINLYVARYNTTSVTVTAEGANKRVIKTGSGKDRAVVLYSFGTKVADGNLSLGFSPASKGFDVLALAFNGEIPVAGSTTTTTTKATTTTTVVKSTTTTTAAPTTTSTSVVPVSNGSAPTAPPVTWCETGLPTSPYTTAPSGAVTVPAGDNSSVDFGQTNTTYWFAPGTHTLGGGQYGQIQVGKGDTYMGAPGAILSGQNVNQSAFVGDYQDLSLENVTIEYLTIENFAPNQGSGAINANGNNGWTEKYNLMKNNTPGAAMMLGGNNIVSDNCMTTNGEYGFNGYSYVDETIGKTFTGGATNITFTDNDITNNNTMKTQDGIEGGGKFWQNGNVVVTGNYVHSNIDSPGLWMDTDNAGFLVQNNYISNNDGEGLFYEISYNAQIVNNTFVGNAIKGGLSNPSFPTGAIYVSESGGNASVPSNYAGVLNIQNNVFQDNWSGVVMYQNPNRYPGDGQDPGPLVAPAGTSITDWINNAPSICPSKLSVTSPVNYSQLCQWRVQNVSVQDNAFRFNPSDAVFGGQCSTSKSCGENAIFSNYSSTPAYPTWTVCNSIGNSQNNHFLNNSYTGPWMFNYFNQGDVATPSQWQAGINNVEGSGDNFGAQDHGSTFTS